MVVIDNRVSNIFGIYVNVQYCFVVHKLFQARIGNPPHNCKLTENRFKTNFERDLILLRLSFGRPLE